MHSLEKQNSSVDSFTSAMQGAAEDVSKATNSAVQALTRASLSQQGTGGGFPVLFSPSSRQPINQVTLDVNGFFMLMMTHPVSKVCFKSGRPSPP